MGRWEIFKGAATMISPLKIVIVMIWHYVDTLCCMVSRYKNSTRPDFGENV